MSKRLRPTQAVVAAVLVAGVLSAADNKTGENVAKGPPALSSHQRVLAQRSVTLPHSGVRLEVFKVLDRRTGDSQQLALRDGRPVSYEAALRNEERIRWQRFGSLDPQLHRLAGERPQQVFPVLIKMNVPESRLDRSRLGSRFDVEAAEPTAARLEADVERRASEAFSAMLASVGASSSKSIAPPMGPFVQARLSGRALRALAHDRRVAFVGLHGQREVLDAVPGIPESLPTTRSDFVQGLGVAGAGVRIAILEGGSLAVPADCFNIGAVMDTSVPTSVHTTFSAGIIGNRFSAGACTGPWQGYAPEATVLLANRGFANFGVSCADYPARYFWAKTQGVNVVTMSWHCGDEERNGNLSARDVFFDYATTHYPYPTVFTSAGNQAEEGTFASGKGYNILGVANVKNDGDGNRCNDTLATSSSWRNPTSLNSDREVPALASPGSGHALLGDDGPGFDGTSCATAVTASIAALLMSANPNLKFWPEGVRAILLATANYQNADGASFLPGADGKDGVGMTNAQYAYWTATRQENTPNPQFRAHDYGPLDSGSFEGGFLTKTWTAYTGTLASRIRVALTWNSKTDGTDVNPASSVLDSDLDIWVYDPDGVPFAVSASWDSNNEFVEFTPSKVGNYTIKVRGWNVPSDFASYYGIAWTTHYDLCS